jgi:hypothetical protein
MQATGMMSETIASAGSVAHHGSPRVSVIIPLDDDRGLALRSVQSWVAGQRCDPSLFEVIALTGPGQRALEPAIRALLRPNDRLLCLETDNGMELSCQGAEAARGDILFFTDGHCVAEPDNVAETIAFLDDDERIDGFYGSATSINPNEIARMEGLAFQEVFAERSRPASWSKVMIRMFAIRKAVYLASGGFQSRYMLFAEPLLAATLHRQGYRLAHAPRVSVAHGNTASFDAFASSIRAYVEPECSYRDSAADWDFCMRYFGIPTEWAQARSAAVRRAGAAAIVRGALRAAAIRWHDPRAVRSLLVAALKLAPATLLGNWSLLLRYRLHVWAAWTAFYAAPLSRQRRYRAYQRFWGCIAQYYRVRWVISNGRQIGPGAAPPPRTRDATLTENDVFGFHSPEQFAGARFRWSGRFAGMRLPLPAGCYRLVLTAPPIRPAQQTGMLIACMNGRIIDAKCDSTLEQIQMDIGPDHFASRFGGWLFIVTEPWRQARQRGEDCRSLGLPLREIRAEVPGQPSPAIVWRGAL